MDYLHSLLVDPAAWIAFSTLLAMEIILGIDNLLFISILTNRLPEKERPRARAIGIGAALVLRLLLLGSVAFIVKLVDPVFTIFSHDFSWKDIILIAGGLFLVWKATKEIHHQVDPESNEDTVGIAVATNVGAIVAQILLLDVVFSIDSIITAVGMTKHLPIMFAAVIISVITMLLAAKPLSKFIGENPTIIMLALGFLLMIGTTLIAEGMGFHVPKGYIYAAMAFSALIEALNMWSKRSRRKARRENLTK